MKRAETGALRSLLDFLAQVAGQWGPGPWSQAIASLQETPALAGLISESTVPGSEPIESWLSLRLTPAQWEAARATESRALTVVVGGVGSGKTHLAAMLAGYWLSREKRVLITSDCPRALDRLRQCELPAPPAAATELMRRLAKLEEQQLEHIRQVWELSEASRLAQSSAGKHDWIPGPIQGSGELPLTASEVAELYDWQVGAELESTLQGSLPDPARLMTELDLSRLKELEVPFREYSDEVFWQSDLHSEEALQALHVACRRAFEAMEEAEDWWLEAAWEVRRNSETGLFFEDLSRELGRLQKSRDELSAQLGDFTADLSPLIPLADQQTLAQELLNAVAARGSLGWATTAFKPRWKRFLEVTRVNGERPGTADDFRKLALFLERRQLLDAAVHAADEEIERLCGYAPHPPGLDRTQLVKGAVRFYRDYFGEFEKCASVAGLRWEKALSHTTLVKLGPGGELKLLRTAIQSGLQAMIGRRLVYLELVELRRREERTLGWVPATKAVGKAQDARDLRSGLRAAVVGRDVDSYRELLARLRDLVALKPRYERRKELLARLAQVAPAWAEAIERGVPGHVPGDLQAAWAYRLGQQRLGTARPQPQDSYIADFVRRLRDELSRGALAEVDGLFIASPEVALEVREQFDWLIVLQAGRSPLPHALLLSLAERALILGDPAQCQAAPARRSGELEARARSLSSLPANCDGLYPLLGLLPPAARLTDSLRLRPRVVELLSTLGSQVLEGYHLSDLPGPALVESVASADQQECHAASLALALLRQPEHSHRSLSLISLSGRRQARRLEALLAEELEESEKLRLQIGSAEDMQGGQSDLAVVLCSGLRTNLQSRRRLEVALSRACDQVWLVHEHAHLEKLPPDDLRRSLLQALREPGGAIGWPATLRGLIGQALTGNGLRPRPVGPWGLAVGRQMLLCYGEKRPESEDLAWENGLERLGWQLERLSGQGYWEDPAGFLTELRGRLLAPAPDAGLEQQVEGAAEAIRGRWPRLADPDDGVEWDVSAFPPAWREPAEQLLGLPGLAIEPGDTLVIRSAGQQLELHSPERAMTQAQEFLRGLEPVPRPGLLAAQPDGVSAAENQEMTDQEAIGPPSAELLPASLEASPIEASEESTPESSPIIPASRGGEPSNPAVRPPGGKAVAPPSGAGRTASVKPPGGKAVAPPSGAGRTASVKPPGGKAVAPPSGATVQGRTASVKPPSGKSVTPPSGATVQGRTASVKPPGGKTVSPPSGATVRGRTASVKPPGGKTVAPPSGATVQGRTASVKPPGGKTVAPPSGASVQGRTGSAVKPPGGKTVAPPSGAAVQAPPPSGRTAPPSGAEVQAPSVKPPGSKTVAPPSGAPVSARSGSSVKPPGARTVAPPSQAPPGDKTVAPPAVNAKPLSGKTIGASTETGAVSVEPPVKPPTVRPPGSKTPSVERPSTAPTTSVKAHSRAPVSAERPPVKPPGGAIRLPSGQSTRVRPSAAGPRPAPVEKDELMEVRRVMLKAFRLIKPPLPEVVQELLEGVTSVTLERRRTEEHRRAPRLNCRYEVRCQVQDYYFPALVTEVSLTGARIELPERLARNVLLELHPQLSGSELEPVRCSVRWCRQSGKVLAAGLAFHESPTRLSRSWVAVLLHSLGFGEEQAYQRRKNVRVPANQPIRLQVGETSAEGRALDVGVGGLLLETEARLARGAHLHLTLGGDLGMADFALVGQVVSVRAVRSPQPRYGVQFVDMTPALMIALGDYILCLLDLRSRQPRCEAPGEA